MHNNDSFIDEVSEEVRRDKLYAGLRRYRWLIAALVLLLVGGAAVNEWLKLTRASRAESAGDAFRTAYAETDAATRAADLGDLAVSNARAAVLARLAEAGAKAEAGDTEGAAALLGEVAGDGQAGELYRALAALQRVMLMGSAMDASERQATLELLVNPGAPFRPLALEQRALMHLDAGDKAAAIADLQAVLAEPAAGEALRGRARQLIIAAGGTLPAPAAVAADGGGNSPMVRPHLSLALTLAVVLAGCAARDPILPGERIPVRAEDAPVAGGSRTALGLPAPVMNAEWTHRNGAARGRLVNPALRPVPQLVWATDIGQGDAKRRRLITGPIVAGGLVFTLDAAGQVTAVTRSGQIAWTRSLVPDGGIPDGGTGGGFAEAGGVLYVTTGFGEVWALDPRTGGTLWQTTLEAPIRAAPAVADGRVIVVQRDDTAYALDARTGDTLWRVQGVGGPGLLGGASPAIDGQLAVIPFASGEVLGVLARNGLTVWGTAVTGGRRDVARNNITDISGDPVIAGDTVYASNQAGRTTRIDGRTGERAWTIPEGSYGPAWPVGGSVFLLSDEGALVRADAASGALLWTVQLPELFPNPGWFGRGKPFRAVAYYGPTLAGGRLWVAGADGLLRAFNPANGAALAEVALPGGAAAEPAVAGGVMYVVTRDGQLLAFQ